MKGSLSDLFKAHDHDVVDKTAPILKNTKAVLMLLVGRKRSGKTSLWLSMLNSKKLYGDYFDNIFLISPSTSDEKVKPLIDELDKEGKFYKELNEPNIEKIKGYIKDEQSRIKMYDKKHKTKTPLPRNLLIMDDVIVDIPRSFKKNVISSLFYNMRHFSLSCLIISQSYKLLQTNIRKQIDMIYAFPMTNLKEKEALQEDWDIPDRIFDECFDDESDHPFLTVNVTGSKPVFFRKMDRIE
jgi:AAA+ ATPase superfamily predicted ATPase